MKMIDIAEFKNAVEDSGGEHYGEYNGRGYFKGYAATFEDVSSLISLGAYLQEMAMDDPPVEGASEILSCRPHIDSMATGIVVAWPKKYFTGIDQ